MTSMELVSSLHLFLTATKTSGVDIDFGLFLLRVFFKASKAHPPTEYPAAIERDAPATGKSTLIISSVIRAHLTVRYG
jgi:hypothetical protein